MYYLLSLLTGILISAMVAFNGGLTGLYGVYPATIIIHLSGLLLISALIIIKRERPFSKSHQWFLYLGGVIGVATTAFNNLAFGRISVSAILAIGLLGQSLAGLIIDQYGFLSMPKHPFRKRKIIGLLLVFCGIISMIDKFDIMAVAVSFAAGINIVISRTLNARLAGFSSVRISTFYNYLIGLVISVPVCFLLGGAAPLTPISISPNLYIYLGGILGVCVVLLSNITVAKVSAFYLSLFLFIGQVFSGILIDAVISQAFSPNILAGGVFVAAGLCVNLLLDRNQTGGKNIEPKDSSR